MERRRRASRLTRTRPPSTKKSLLRSQLRRLQLQLSQRLSSQSQTSLQLVQVSQLRKFPRISSPHSALELLTRSTVLQTTSHQSMRTLSREDMLAFSSQLLLSRKPSTPSTRTSCTSRVSMITLRPSTFSLKTVALAPKKSSNSTMLFRVSPLSTHLPSSSWKSSLRTRDYRSSVPSLRDTRSCINFLTRKKRSLSFLPSHSASPRVMKCLQP